MSLVDSSDQLLSFRVASESPSNVTLHAGFQGNDAGSTGSAYTFIYIHIMRWGDARKASSPCMIVGIVGPLHDNYHSRDWGRGGVCAFLLTHHATLCQLSGAL